jgi:hypothetical protein
MIYRMMSILACTNLKKRTTSPGYPKPRVDRIRLDHFTTLSASISNQWKINRAPPCAILSPDLSHGTLRAAFPSCVARCVTDGVLFRARLIAHLFKRGRLCRFPTFSSWCLVAVCNRRTFAPAILPRYPYAHR